MLVRSLCLKAEIVEWLLTASRSDQSLEKFILTDMEWMHVQYVVVLLRPYSLWTEALSQQKSATIQRAWVIYDRLFKHLEKYQARLNRKNTPCKRHLGDLVSLARQKLMDYHDRTEQTASTA
jgi:hypothetical protein